MNIIVFYNAGYMEIKSELHNILLKLGDKKSDTELVASGMMGLSTELNPRNVIESIQDNFVSNPDSIRFIKKLVPIDYFTDLDKLNETIKDDIKSIIKDNLYNVEVHVHSGNADSNVIRNEVTDIIKGRINEDHPQLIIRIDIFESKAAIGLLKSSDIFSR